jgi:hypothetical protein
MYGNEILLLTTFLLNGCVKALYYCYYFQASTGVDILTFIADNPEAMNIILRNVINFVESDMAQNISMEVFLSDADIMGLILYVITNFSDNGIISSEILIELGLHTNSIIAYLFLLGFNVL